jgi:group I intron endonuclease
MPDYSKGKIYGIRNTLNEKIYIGSTTQPLNERFSNHLADCKSSKLYSLKKPVNELGEQYFFIELLEEYSCNNKKELENMENYWIGFFIELLGRENVYNLDIDGKRSQQTKDKMRGINNVQFQRGCIYI